MAHGAEVKETCQGSNNLEANVLRTSCSTSVISLGGPLIHSYHCLVEFIREVRRSAGCYATGLVNKQPSKLFITSHPVCCHWLQR